MQALFWISFGVIFCVCFGYPLLIGLLAFLKPVKETRDLRDEELPHVSLIIAAYNEEQYIERKLQNFFDLDYPEEKLEIIVGSDGSDDRTNEIVTRYVSDSVHFFSHSVRRGKMAVVNDGVAAAKGDICVFTDVSEVFDKDAVKKLVRNFQDNSVGAVTGNHIFNPSPAGLAKGVNIYWLYQRWLQRMESRVSTIISCDGTIYACRRKLFEAPPAGTINDDKAVPWKFLEKGKRILFEPEAIARGDALEDTVRFFRQKVRGQAGMYQLFFMFKNLFVPKQLMFWFIFMSHAVGPVIVPWFVALLLFSNVMLACEMPYKVFFYLQLIFYAGAVIAMIAQYFRIRVPVLHIPYVFTISNAASICGFWAFIFKTQKATWTKVE